MISKLAEAEIQALEKSGLRPTARDIVRLNALALKVEAASAERAASSPDFLPRIARLSPEMYLREPTIAHHIWLAELERHLAPGDYESMLAVKAFALSRPVAELPDPGNIPELEKTLKAAMTEFGNFTRAQIFAAIDYVIYGRDAEAFESPPPKKDADEPLGEDDVDWGACYAVGTLNEGRAILHGITGAEMREMTERELRGVIERASFVQGIVDNDKRLNRSTGEFYATLDEIRARLEKEVSKNG